MDLNHTHVRYGFFGIPRYRDSLSNQAAHHADSMKAIQAELFYKRGLTVSGKSFVTIDTAYPA